MGSWTIKKSVQDLLPPANYDVRIDEITPGVSGNGNFTIKFKTTVVGGSQDGKTVFFTRTIRADIIGIFAKDLAATQAFDEDEELSDDHELLAREVANKIGGKVYTIDYSHRLNKADNKIYSNVEIVGPTSGAFK